MNLHTLTQHAANSEIRELELLSLEGGVYLARIRLDHGQFTLLDEAAQPMHLRSIPTCGRCCTPCRHFRACWCSTACTTKCAAAILGLSGSCASRFRFPRRCEGEVDARERMSVSRWFGRSLALGPQR